LAEEFVLVAASIFLTKLVRELSILRANIIATGLPPLTQTKHWGLPAAEPVTFNGWNAPILLLPTSGPDLRGSAAYTPLIAIASIKPAPIGPWKFITLSPKDNHTHKKQNRPLSQIIAY
jgi:hypothetical protein